MATFSSRALRLLGDELAGESTLAKIADMFEDAGIERGPDSAAEGVNGARRSLMTQYVSTLDLRKPADTARLVDVFNAVLFDIAHRVGNDEVAAAWLRKLVDRLRRDGFEVDEHHQIVATSEVTLSEQSLSSLGDASVIRDHLERMDQSIASDPRLAVSVAKDLVESTAKLVLRSRGEMYSKNEDVPALVSRAQKALKLNASGVEGDGEEGRALKRILQALTSLTQGIAELRNQVGIGRGRESVPTWVRPRHARLAAGAAQTWCGLMLETLEDPSAPWRNP